MLNSTANGRRVSSNGFPSPFHFLHLCNHFQVSYSKMSIKLETFSIIYLVTTNLVEI